MTDTNRVARAREFHFAKYGNSALHTLTTTKQAIQDAAEFAEREVKAAVEAERMRLAGEFLLEIDIPVAIEGLKDQKCHDLSYKIDVWIRKEFAQKLQPKENAR